MKTSKIVIGGAIGLFLLHACTPTKKEQQPEDAVTVEIYSPDQLSEKGFYLSGEVVARQTATISTRTMGYIHKIGVKPGDRFRQGELLVTITSDDLLARKAQAEAMITEAEAAASHATRDYERFQTLHAKNSVSDKEFENVALQHTSMQAKVKMAHQQLNEVNAQLAYTRIRAPFNGVVTQKMADEGSMANPGMPILTIEQEGRLQIAASAPESYVRHVKVGDEVIITLKSLGITVPGMVSEISPSAHRSGGQYAMKIAFDASQHPDIQAGMYANILFSIPLEEESTPKILLDQASVVHREQLTGVYVVNDQNRAVLRWVRLGKVTGNQVEVLSGVTPGEKVVLKADGKLYNGRKVIVSN